MNVNLLYGKGTLDVQLPSQMRATLIEKPPMPISADPAADVYHAIRSATGSDSLRSLAAGASSACIAICDITRPVPNGLFLRPMIEEMLDAGMEMDRITILVATGLHRPNVGAELEELIGDSWVLQNICIENHDARDDSEHIDLGVTPARGTSVKIDRRFVEADLRIATGLVEPHFMAGYSGGRKVIAPGLAHAETITTFHSARFMANPAAANCNFEGNPLHEEQLEIVKLLGGAYALNTIIDDQRRLSYVNFGEIIASHQQAVAKARQYCEVSLDRQFSTVVTSAAGYPLDKTYYQTVKGMVGAMEILRPGGDLIIASECSEGLGSQEFVQSQRRLVEHGPDQFLQQIHAKTHADIDEWQTQMQLKPQEIGSIHLCSDLSSDDQQWTGVSSIDSVKQAIVTSVAKHNDPEIAVIPEGPYIVPFYRPAAHRSGSC